MNATAKAAKSASVVTLPTRQQMIFMALGRAEDVLETLIKARIADEHWDDADIDVDMAVMCAMDHVQSMKSTELKEPHSFSGSWFRAAGVINLAHKSFSRRDCYYWRVLEGAKEMFSEVDALVEYVAHQTKKQGA